MMSAGGVAGRQTYGIGAELTQILPEQDGADCGIGFAAASNASGSRGAAKAGVSGSGGPWVRPSLQINQARRLWRHGRALPGHGRWAFVDGPLHYMHRQDLPLQGVEAQRVWGGVAETAKGGPAYATGRRMRSGEGGG